MSYLCNEIPRPLSLERAHRLMQLHGQCSVRYCQCRRAALDTLVEAGHYVPASRFG